MMLVSVIIPAYNRASLLQEAIESCRTQTYRPIECIVVDDGSTDDTQTLMENLTGDTGDGFRVVYIRQENKGAQAARNTGTQIATGEFIQYLDSDDLLYPNKLEMQVKFLEEHKAYDAVYGDWETGSIEKKEKVEALKEENLIGQFLTGRGIHTLAMLMRRKLVNAIGDWDLALKRNQEIDFHLRGVLTGAAFAYQPLLCGLWRIHDGERIVNSNGLQHSLFFFSKWEKILIHKGLLDEKIKQQLASLYKWLIFNNSNAGFKELTQLFSLLKKNDPSLKIFTDGGWNKLAAIAGEKTAFRLWSLTKTGRKKEHG